MHRLLRTALLAPVVVMAAVGPVRADDELKARIEKIITQENYRHSRWGILVEDGDGKAVYEHEADRFFLPASTTKLFSCAAALATFGKDYRFETPVYAHGTVADGHLKGDLILVAQGDLTMGGRTLADGTLAFKDHDHTYANGSPAECEVTTGTDPLAGLKALARQVKEKGIRRIDGDVLVDDRLFAHARGSGSGPDVLSPILINDNVIDLVITPGTKAGDPAVIKMIPDNHLLQVDCTLETVAVGVKRVEVETVGPMRVHLRGQIPVNGSGLLVNHAVEDPAAFARSLFIDALRGEGVAVDVSPLGTAHALLPEWDSYARDKPLAVFTSPPLAEAIKVTLKVSHNLYASTLPLLLAARHHKRTLAEGLRLQREVLSTLGVDVDSVSFGGGAGGNNADSVTPRAAVQVLRGMAAKQPDAYPAYLAALPRLGVDGTLADAVPKDSPARDKVQAKTGTLTWQDLLNDRPLLRSKALAGVLTNAKGKPYTFALYVNDVPLPRDGSSRREGKQLGKVCEVLYQHTP